MAGPEEIWRPSGICWILLCDVAAFSDSRRSADVHDFVRRKMYDALEEGLAAGGIHLNDATTCYVEDRGDGVIVILPPAIGTGVLSAVVIDVLRASVRRHNALAAEAAQLRLRVAIHCGEVHSDESGPAGSALIHAFRLLDAAELREAVAAAPAAVAVIISDTFFADVVNRPTGFLDPGDFQRVRVSVKETESTAWIAVPGLRAEPKRSVRTVAEPPGPPTVARKGPIGSDLAFELVDALLAITWLRGERNRDRVVGELPLHIAGAIPRSADARTDLLSIVRTSLDYPGGLSQLHKSVRLHAGGSLPVLNLERVTTRALADEFGGQDPLQGEGPPIGQEPARDPWLAEYGVVGGRYRLRSRLGDGGMASVWLAHDELLDRDVAVKEVFLPRDLSPEGERFLYSRSLREARTLARLNHPGLLTVYDVVRESSRPYLVTELLHGRSLREILDIEGPQPPHRVAEIGRQLLAALDRAHGAGVLHRDLKPANVLISEGRVVIADFGISRIDGTAALTTTGLVLGTPAYMSPEQIMGERAGPASDLWSLGATLYAALEGHAPYERESSMACIAAAMTEPIPESPRAGVLWPVLEGLLARDPERRMTAATALPLLREIAVKPDVGDGVSHGTDRAASALSSPTDSRSSRRIGKALRSLLRSRTVRGTSSGSPQQEAWATIQRELDGLYTALGPPPHAKGPRDGR